MVVCPLKTACEGYFTIPTIFGNKSNEWRLAKEEIFGPVLVAIPWDDEEVARMANQSHYGWPRMFGLEILQEELMLLMQLSLDGFRLIKAWLKPPDIHMVDLTIGYWS